MEAQNDDNNEEVKLEGIVSIPIDAQEGEGAEKTKRTSDKPHGNMSKISHFRKLAEVKEEFEGHCDGWQEKVAFSN